MGLRSSLAVETVCNKFHRSENNYFLRIQKHQIFCSCFYVKSENTTLCKWSFKFWIYLTWKQRLLTHHRDSLISLEQQHHWNSGLSTPPPVHLRRPLPFPSTTLSAFKLSPATWSPRSPCMKTSHPYCSISLNLPGASQFPWLGGFWKMMLLLLLAHFFPAPTNSTQVLCSLPPSMPFPCSS